MLFFPLLHLINWFIDLFDIILVLIDVIDIDLNRFTAF